MMENLRASQVQQTQMSVAAENAVQNLQQEIAIAKSYVGSQNSEKEQFMEMAQLKESQLAMLTSEIETQKTTIQQLQNQGTPISSAENPQLMSKIQALEKRG